MTECWNCHRQCERYTRTCPYCGAALPVYLGPELPPGWGAPLEPEPAPEPVRRPPPRPRSDFVLNDPASVRERAAETTGFYAEKAAQEISHVQRLVNAMAKNAQAAAILVICVCVVGYAATLGTSYEDLGTVDATSQQEAMAGQLFHRQAVPSVDEVTFGGRKIHVDEAWVAQLGRYEKVGFVNRAVVAVPSGKYRMYFKITVKDGPEDFTMTTGNPPVPVGKVNATRDGVPFVLRFIELPSFVNPPQTVIISNPAKPGDGTAKIVIH